MPSKPVTLRTKILTYKVYIEATEAAYGGHVYVNGVDKGTMNENTQISVPVGAKVSFALAWNVSGKAYYGPVGSDDFLFRFEKELHMTMPASNVNVRLRDGDNDHYAWVNIYNCARTGQWGAGL